MYGGKSSRLNYKDREVLFTLPILCPIQMYSHSFHFLLNKLSHTSENLTCESWEIFSPHYFRFFAPCIFGVKLFKVTVTKKNVAHKV